MVRSSRLPIRATNGLLNLKMPPHKERSAGPVPAPVSPVLESQEVQLELHRIVPRGRPPLRPGCLGGAERRQSCTPGACSVDFAREQVILLVHEEALGRHDHNEPMA